MRFRARIGVSGVTLLSLLAAAVFPLVVSKAAASGTSVSYDFNTPGQLANEFNSYLGYGSVAQSNSGGLGGSGSIEAASSADAVFASKDTYSMGPIGSTYRFESYLESIWNSGYSGMGFTSFTVPSGSNSGSSPFRPNDALGLSVHGGGFVFHNGATDYYGNWQGGGSGITTVVDSSMFDLLNSGSNVNWYKIVLIIKRVGTTTFDMRVEVWPSDINGGLLNSSASAIYDLLAQANPDLIGAPSISSYLSFSGSRVRNFDDYSVSLSGGATVVSSGSPVVLTTGAVDANNVVTVDGNVTADGGTPVTQRGVVYAQSASPTLADAALIDSAAGVGPLSLSTTALPGGTYYFRTFATNAVGTSYGAEEQLILATSVPPSPTATVTFDGAGATGGTMAAQSASGPTVLTANGFTRTGFTFDGWATSAGGAVAYADGASFPFSASSTLYAVWSAVAPVVVAPPSSQTIAGSDPSTGPTSVAAAAMAGLLAMTGFTAQQLTWNLAGFAVMAGTALVLGRVARSRRRIVPVLLGDIAGVAPGGDAQPASAGHRTAADVLAGAWRGVVRPQQSEWNPWPGVIAVLSNVSTAVPTAVQHLGSPTEVLSGVWQAVVRPQQSSWNPWPGVVAVASRLGAAAQR